MSEDGDDDDVPEVFNNMSPKEKLMHSVRQMYNLNRKWERILNSEVIDVTAFDSDSHYEVSRFTLKACEAVIRLVPDVFVKAYRSINLAKIWWTQANKVCMI